MERPFVARRGPGSGAGPALTGPTDTNHHGGRSRGVAVPRPRRLGDRTARPGLLDVRRWTVEEPQLRRGTSLGLATARARALARTVAAPPPALMTALQLWKRRADRRRAFGGGAGGPGPSPSPAPQRRRPRGPTKAGRSPPPPPRARFGLRPGAGPSPPTRTEAAAPDGPAWQKPVALDAASALRLRYRVLQLLDDARPAGTGVAMADVVLHALSPLGPHIVAAGSSSPAGGNRRDGVAAPSSSAGGGAPPWSSALSSLLSLPQPRRWTMRRRIRAAEDRRILLQKYRFAHALDCLRNRHLVRRNDGGANAAAAAAVVVQTWEQAKAQLEPHLVFPPSPDQEEKAPRGGPTSGPSPSPDEDGGGDPILREFDRRLHRASLEELANAEFPPSRRQWLALGGRCSVFEEPSRGGDGKGGSSAVGDLADRLKEAHLAHERRRLPKAVAALRSDAERELRLVEEAQKRASGLLRPLTDEELERVNAALFGKGNGAEVLAREGADEVQRSSMQTLRPGCWLNDEVIHYFLVMLAKRDAERCQSSDDQPPRKRSHFFKSFFVTKLLNEGDPAKEGTYEYKNVKRWSKNVPGKDIFELDKVFFPINVSGMHWVCAVAFLQERRIQFYDSLGGDGTDYLEYLWRYLQDEHLDKKRVPLADLEDWTLVPCQPDTPRQLNGFDCGVFTCMFADFLSLDRPLAFNQSHVSRCRERIALSILNGKALD